MARLNSSRISGFGVKGSASFGCKKPLGLDPVRLGHDRFATGIERPQQGTADGRQIAPPPTFGIGFDMRSPTDCAWAQRPRIERFAVETADPALS